MDISKIDNVQELKAMAYDELLTLERVQQNLAMINKRIAEVQETEESKKQVSIEGYGLR